jgi:hypothetical protein
MPVVNGVDHFAVPGVRTAPGSIYYHAALLPDCFPSRPINCHGNLALLEEPGPLLPAAGSSRALFGDGNRCEPHRKSCQEMRVDNDKRSEMPLSNRLNRKSRAPSYFCREVGPLCRLRIEVAMPRLQEMKGVHRLRGLLICPSKDDGRRRFVATSVREISDACWQLGSEGPERNRAVF